MVKLPSSANREDIRSLSRGLLTGEDYISLDPSLRLENHTLIDSITGARHALYSYAPRAIVMLAKSIEARSWIAQLESMGAAPEQIREIIEFLGRIGGLTIQRSLRVKLSFALYWLRSAALGYLPASAARRYHARITGLMAATTKALLPALVALLITSTLWYAAGADNALPIGSLAAITLWVSVVAHEWAHCLPLLGPAVVLQQGWHLGILHHRQAARQEILSAIVGPLAGIATGLIIAPNAIGVLVAIFHLASLLPVSPDGRSIWAGAKAARA